MPYRVVIDPNVFVSALMTKPGSPTLTIAQAVTTGKLKFVACPTLVQELSEVAYRERFRRWFTVEDTQHLVDALTLIAEMHPDPTRIPSVCADPDDNYLFALAQSTGTSIIISGDRKVQAVAVSGIEVMSPRAALAKLDKLS